MKLSVALCSYNGEKFLRPQLRSIAEQTRPPDELVVCDDHSTDATVSILEEFSREATYPVRIEVNSSNIGSTRNFEKAIFLCSGDVIALCDQDDVWNPGKLERIDRVFASDTESSLAFSDAEMVDESLGPLGYRLWEAVGFTASEQGKVRRGEAFPVFLRRNVATGATMAFRSRLKEAVLPIPGTWVHDGWIALVASALGPLTPVPEMLVRYRQHAGQQVSAFRKSFRDRLNIALRMDASDFRLDAIRFEQALERISSLPGAGVDPRAPRAIEAKIRHMEARGNLPGASFSRIPSATRELMAGNYFRYSEHGWISFFQDLVR